MGFDLPAFLKRQRRGDLEQIDRDLRRAQEGFERAAGLLAEMPDGGTARGEALELLERTTALRARCAKLKR